MSTYAIYYEYDIPLTPGLPGAKHTLNVLGARRFEADDDTTLKAQEEWRYVKNSNKSGILNPRFVGLVKVLDWKPHF